VKGRILSCGARLGASQTEDFEDRNLERRAWNVSMPRFSLGRFGVPFRRAGGRSRPVAVASSAERDESLDIDYKLVPMNYGLSSVGLALTGKP
jgi:hypothetical protein